MPRWLRDYLGFLRFSAAMVFIGVPIVVVVAVGLPIAIHTIFRLPDWTIPILLLLNMAFVLMPAIFWFVNSPKMERAHNWFDRVLGLEP